MKIVVGRKNLNRLPQAYNVSFAMSTTYERAERQNDNDIADSQNIPSFILYLQQLHQILETEDEITDSTLTKCVDIWLYEFDRGEKTQLLQDTMLNNMHVYGMGLCVLASRYMKDNAGDKSHPRTLHQPDKLQQYMSQFYEKLVFVNKKPDHFEFEDIHTLICSIQLHFEEMYEKKTDQDSKKTTFRCAIDMQNTCILLIAQLGHWLSVKYKERAKKTGEENKNPTGRGEGNIVCPAVECPEMNMPEAALKGFVDMDHDGFCALRIDALTFLLDSLHSMLSLHKLMMNAQYVERGKELIEVNGHHKEASAEVFFSLSMTADCMPGSIVQYAHKFAYLFHSISQVVYYNFPTYNRQRQLNIVELQKENVSCINLLPLLTELRPDIPFACEHTGAGFKPYHSTNKWSWVLWAHYVFLVDAEMNVYMADDIRTLLHLLHDNM